MQAGLPAEEAERQVFGVDHIQWGVKVGKTWDFPPDVVEAIAEHHDGGGNPLTWVTWNGRRVAWSLGIGDGLVVPDEVSFDPDSDDAGIVDAAGGAEGLRIADRVVPRGVLGRRLTAPTATAPIDCLLRRRILDPDLTPAREAFELELVTRVSP